MGILGSVNVDVGSVFTGIGTLAKDIRSAITGDVSPEKKAELAVLAAQLESQATMAQVAVNQAEAANPNWFVAGARPAILWVCAIALAWNFIGHPIAMWMIAIFKPDTVPPPLLAADNLFELMLGMLGLGGFRMYEKLKGVARS